MFEHKLSIQGDIFDFMTLHINFEFVIWIKIRIEETIELPYCVKSLINIGNRLIFTGFVAFLVMDPDLTFFLK